MDSQLAASAGIGSSTMAAMFIAYRVFKALNGHRLVSDCCGKKGEIGFVVRDMVPSPPIETENPPSALDVGGAKPETVVVSLPNVVEPSRPRTLSMN